jgi:hypothetical protein
MPEICDFMAGSFSMWVTENSEILRKRSATSHRFDAPRCFGVDFKRQPTRSDLFPILCDIENIGIVSTRLGEEWLVDSLAREGENQERFNLPYEERFGIEESWNDSVKIRFGRRSYWFINESI